MLETRFCLARVLGAGSSRKSCRGDHACQPLGNRNVDGRPEPRAEVGRHILKPLPIVARAVSSLALYAITIHSRSETASGPSSPRVVTTKGWNTGSASLLPFSCYSVAKPILTRFSKTDVGVIGAGRIRPQNVCDCARLAVLCILSIRFV
jgi:hypothetical protein